MPSVRLVVLSAMVASLVRSQTDINTPGWVKPDSTNGKPKRALTAAAPSDLTLYPEKMYLFGGYGESGSVTAEFVEWPVSMSGDFTAVSARGTAPAARHSHRMDLVGQTLVVHGGATGTTQATVRNDVCLFHFSNASWTPCVNTTFARSGHSSASWNNTIVYFGGESNTALTNDVFRYNAGTRQMEAVPTTGTAPSARKYASAVVTQRNVLYVFGGANATAPIDRTFYKLDLTRATWSSVAPAGPAAPPLPRWKHTAVYCQNYGRIVVFGGVNSANQHLADVRIFDIWSEKWVETAASMEETRSKHVAFPRGGIGMVVFGGVDSGEGIKDQPYVFNHRTMSTTSTGSTGTTGTSSTTSTGTTSTGTTSSGTTSTGTSSTGTSSTGTTSTGTSSTGTTSTGTTSTGTTSSGTTSTGTTSTGTTSTGTTSTGTTSTGTTSTGAASPGTTAPRSATAAASSSAAGVATTAWAEPAEAPGCCSDSFVIDGANGPIFEVSAAQHTCSCYGLSDFAGGWAVGVDGTRLRSIRTLQVEIGPSPPAGQQVVGTVSKPFAWGPGVTYADPTKLRVSVSAATTSDEAAVFAVTSNQLTATGGVLSIHRVDEFGRGWSDPNLFAVVTVYEEY